jgi:ribosomal protein S18 acetylase RimI-like enzyme
MTEKEIEIRRATETDVQSIVKLSYALFQEDAGQRDPFVNLEWPKEEGKEHYSSIVARYNGICLLAIVDGAIVGYLAGYTRDKSSFRLVKLAELESMFVNEDFRGQQVGTKLVRKFLEWSREKEAQRVSVSAYYANSRAIDFYQGLGFEPKSLTLELGIEE